MRRRHLSLGLVPLLVMLACESKPLQPVAYGPWEEGLTLAYEDPSLPAAEQRNHRLQVRVAKSRLAPGEPGLVQLDFASGNGQFALQVRHRKGGVALVADDGRTLAQPLPEGFPNIGPWEDRGTSYRVLGRGTWEGASLLPPGASAVGVWVEATPSSGPRRRTLYLPNLGEVESREERQGAWITVNRLVARGFTDLPAIKPAH
jgi:hypothetical protein